MSGKRLSAKKMSTSRAAKQVKKKKSSKEIEAEQRRFLRIVFIVAGIWVALVLVVLLFR